jgi:hypothetical protein
MNSRIRIEVQSRLRRRIAMISVGLCVFGSIGYLLYMRFHIGYGPPPQKEVFWIISIPLLIATFGFVGAITWWRPIRLPMGSGICRACGYDMRGHDILADRCPECGRLLSEKAENSWFIFAVRLFPSAILSIWAMLSLLFSVAYMFLWFAGGIGGR